MFSVDDVATFTKVQHSGVALQNSTTWRVVIVSKQCTFSASPLKHASNWCAHFREQFLCFFFLLDSNVKYILTFVNLIWETSRCLCCSSFTVHTSDVDLLSWRLSFICCFFLFFFKWLCAQEFITLRSFQSAGNTRFVFLESLQRQYKRFYYRRNLSLKPFSCKCLEACSVWRFVSLKRFDLTSCILSVKLGNFHCWPILGMERQNTPALHDLKQI